MNIARYILSTGDVYFPSTASLVSVCNFKQVMTNLPISALCDGISDHNAVQSGVALRHKLQLYDAATRILKKESLFLKAKGSTDRYCCPSLVIPSAVEASLTSSRG